ncbi:SRPBCC family protein [Halalkalibacter krulwichiae]|uniref:Activator of Hsp90 ATPase homologue 1/2-like C-terminal domain-containing protein n=1 Tax=Halalkalibacter krulwichiae TaxID=199441 RepID=A0A1X9MAS8_9BACI|nr:SRPBCC domain-containing protein [Halalkalibacter krulwichiae]ARK30517.1 hypothetical protein BkAM31D_12125 [Halalkalibacter krulwichiae]
MSDHKASTPDIRKQAVFNAKIEKVWDIVASSKGIDQWFMPNNFQPEEGAEFTIHSPFGPSTCKVLEIHAPNRLVFTWGEMGWKITFELKDLGDKTEFTLIHAGWGLPEEIVPGPGPDQSNLDIRNRMNDGWESIVNENLRKAVEV